MPRIGHPHSEAGSSDDAEETVPAPVERAAPGVASLLAGLTPDGSLSVLDLGSASESSFQLYAQFARRIQFADILVGPSCPEGFSARLEALGPDRHPQFDLVLAWNILVWLRKEDRPALVEGVGAWLRAWRNDRVKSSPTGVATHEVPEAESVQVRQVPIPDPELT